MSGKFTTAHKSTGNGDDVLPQILIVDDSPAIRVSLTRFVRDEFVPLETSEGEQA